jgi:hypothetical protein
LPRPLQWMLPGGGAIPRLCGRGCGRRFSGRRALAQHKGHPATRCLAKYRHAAREGAGIAKGAGAVLEGMDDGRRGLCDGRARYAGGADAEVAITAHDRPAKEQATLAARHAGKYETAGYTPARILRDAVGPCTFHFKRSIEQRGTL